MSKFIIEGQARLSGEVKVSGAKNSALKIIPAAILTEEKLEITNFPLIEDTNRALELASDLGAEISRDKDRCEIECRCIVKNTLESKFANKFRASIMFAGPILARTGEVKFPLPGGCVIGAGGRPIDLFLEGFASLGAEIETGDHYYHLKAKRLKGGYFFFPIVSVTGTEAMMMTAVLAEGKTKLHNCALEPEIIALADYLNGVGAKISGAGTPTIIIQGVKKINAGRFSIIPDRIETGSFALLAAATKSTVTISHCVPEHIRILLAIFNKIGIPYEEGSDFLIVKPSAEMKSYSIKTHEYPGFPTDLQSPYAVLMTQTKGSSLIHETIYDRRLLYVDMLIQMGADIIMCDPHRVVVNGPTKLYGMKLTSPDLRAGLAMIIAALAAQGQTEIDNIYQIDRGYELIDDRLRALGADIKRLGTLNL
jgi:UDP-N-acetylglucosamine 1-carboxyvinyltransferase